MDPPDEQRPSREAYRVTWERWQEVDALFERVLDLPEHAWENAVASQAADDEELAAAVLDLLAVSSRASRLLDRVDTPLLRAALRRPVGESTGTLEVGEHVGRYRVTGDVGRGGMATVYAAVRADGAFDRRVAIKVLRRGLDTEDLVRRALAERQILSGLQHPNIATLLDGGATADGRPFLVMELVEGEPISRWVERNELSPVERVRLFLQVVDAVGYAHGQLVVHRDLKPSNVLITPAGRVKLLDFGVAKLLGGPGRSDEPLTRVVPAPMTPEFASPEQLRGDRVTAGSDVFQLGVLLYQLLTDTRPFTGDTLRNRMIGDQVEVSRPSEAASSRQRGRILRGDLDTIVMKAMEFDPMDRYGSAEALAADLRRWLDGLPIAARSASGWVRLRKFSRRNPWFWPVAATLVVGVSGYVATVLRYSHRVEAERNEALQQAERAEALRAFMVGQFGAADPYSDEPGGPGVTVVEAMDLGAEAARRELADQPLLEAEMLSSIAQVYVNLSLASEARSLLDEAMTIRREQGAANTPEQIEDLGLLGWALSLEGQRDSAHTLLRRRYDLERARVGDHPRTAQALERLSWHRYEDGAFQEALAWSEEAVRIRREVLPVDSTALSASLAVLADAYRAADRWEDARGAAAEAYEISRARLGEEHATTAGNKGHLAQVVHGAGDLEGAIALYREVLPVLERTLGPQHVTTLSNWSNLGIVLAQANDERGAEEVMRRILEIRLERYGPQEHAEVATSLQNLAALLVRSGGLVEADSLARRAERIYRSVHGDQHYSVAFSLITRTEVALQDGRPLDAERSIHQAIGILEPQFGPGFPTAAARCRLGRALLVQGRRDEALPIIRTSLDALRSGAAVPDREIELCEGALASNGSSIRR